jgi:hypothetical protein
LTDIEASQGASLAGASGATEDAAARRPARPRDTATISPNPPTRATRSRSSAAASCRHTCSASSARPR